MARKTKRYPSDLTDVVLPHDFPAGWPSAPLGEWFAGVGSYATTSSARTYRRP
uniref:Putative transposase n=1 Tax=Ralstonia syzygii R24 TaxID=907261 RepID=G3A8D6_9RALS